MYCSLWPICGQHHLTRHVSPIKAFVGNISDQQKKLQLLTLVNSCSFFYESVHAYRHVSQQMANVFFLRWLTKIFVGPTCRSVSVINE